MAISTASPMVRPCTLAHRWLMYEHFELHTPTQTPAPAPAPSPLILIPPQRPVAAMSTSPAVLQPPTLSLEPVTPLSSADHNLGIFAGRWH